jgi:pyruvate formate-lyase activating enzyme-like uncharacterized protein
MKKILYLICLFPALLCSAQIDKDQLALAVNKADEANTGQLKSMIWKRKSDVFIEGALKLTTITDFSYDANGKLQAKVIDSQSTVKDKKGIRGKIQENSAEDKMDYVSNALDLALKYTYMTKGELIDFFGKATVTEKNGIIEATAENIYVNGDKMTVLIEAATNLYIFKKFSSVLGKDAIDGQIKYEKFSSGVNHGSTTTLNMPAQKMKIEAVNQDYSVRMN